MEPLDDRLTARALAAARRALARLQGEAGSESARLAELSGELATELEDFGAQALDHLAAGRWDEARDCAETALDLAEEHGVGSRWREFALLVEEAAETGRGAP